jgi:transposase
MNNDHYDHFVAIDWSKVNMAIARMTQKSDKIEVKDVPSDIKDLNLYLNGLRGKKILTIEESTAAQWLYVELRDYVDKLIICDPYRNHLLTEGSKTDKIDAKKLVKLLRAGLLKEVFHSGDEYMVLRKLVSSYEDVVKAGVRLKNQRDALFRGVNKNSKKDRLEKCHEKFILEGVDKGILSYEEEKERYLKEFKRIIKNKKKAKLIKDLPGISDIHAIKIIAIVVDAKRFKSAGHFLSYCGLVKLNRISGGKVYGKKNPRCNKTLKCVFNLAASSALKESSTTNPMKEFYYYLINEKKISERNARQAVKRRLATLCLGILKTETKYNPYQWRKSEKDNKQLNE